MGGDSDATGTGERQKAGLKNAVSSNVAVTVGSKLRYIVGKAIAN